MMKTIWETERSLFGSVAVSTACLRDEARFVSLADDQNGYVIRSAFDRDATDSRLSRRPHGIASTHKPGKRFHIKPSESEKKEEALVVWEGGKPKEQMNLN